MKKHNPNNKSTVNKSHENGLTLGERISIFITGRVGTIGCAILFCIIACISLPNAIESKDALIIVSWLAQTFLQLVLLPIIMIGQDLQSRHSEMLAESTYENDLSMHKDVDEIKDLVKQLLKDKEENNITDDKEV